MKRKIIITLFSILLLLILGVSIYAIYSRPVADEVRHQTTLQETSLPIIVINTHGNGMNRQSRSLASMTIIANDSSLNYADTTAHQGQHYEFMGNVNIKYHGSSSYKISDKKSYSVRLLDDRGKKNKCRLLGMQKAHTWILLAPFIDRSCIRDKFTYDLFRPHFDYLPHMQPVEVIVDGTYKGIYYLTEKISHKSEGLNIGKHGHIVKIDRKREETGFYKSAHKAHGTDVFYDYVYPDNKDLRKAKSAVTKEDIDRQIAEFEDAACQGDLSHIDLRTFASYFIATEFMGNADGYRCSVYFYKNEDDPQHYRMLLWDNDRTYGNSYRHENYDWTKWIYQTTWDFDRNVPPYWETIITHPTFRAEVQRQWKEMRRTILTEEYCYNSLDSLHNILVASGAQQRNDDTYDMWTRGRFFPLTSEQGRFSSIDEEMEYIKRWIHHRLIEMDKFIKNF